jgi:serine/threonine protein kinase
VDPQRPRAERHSDPDDETTLVQVATAHSPRPGMVLRDRFVLQKVLGAGGMSKVFLATDSELEGANPHVAIKVLGDGFKDHPHALTALRREVNNSRQLNHPNIVGVYHFDRDGSIVFMVMEYMRGQTLDDWLAYHRDGVPWEEAWPIIKGCGEALAYMHAHHIIHSDFKPGNVFITDDGEVKVLDLGIARTIDETLAIQGQTRFNSQALFALTPQYASCEMFDGMPPDRRDDIYALGCVAYHLLTGRHPFDGATAPEARARKLRPARPPGLKNRQWQALLQSLAHTRSERSPSAEAFLAGIGPQERRQSSMPWMLASAALLLVVAGFVGVRMFNDSPDQRFVEELIGQYRDLGNSDVPPEQIARWLEQGALNLEIGRRAFEDGDYARGRYFLQDSASSARWVFELVLRQAVDERQKREAARGLLELTKTYEAPATTLHESDRFRESLELACSGLVLNAYNVVLKDLLRRAARRVSDAARVGACAALPEGLRP